MPPFRRCLLLFVHGLISQDTEKEDGVAGTIPVLAQRVVADSLIGALKAIVIPALPQIRRLGKGSVLAASGREGE
jgi:hypothetical protein